MTRLLRPHVARLFAPGTVALEALPEVQPGKQPWWQTVPGRIAGYALLLTLAAIPLCFASLDRGMLDGDEAAFAISSDCMLETGDWVVPTIDRINPHLNAAPMYNWLTCLTAGLTADSPLRHRLWSAIFGVLCTLAVLLLGAELFSPEVGFLAGLLLITNQHFLFHHGPREGVMEPGLMFFQTLMVACYARANRSGARARLWWLLAGVCLGLATLIKPPIMGGFFFTLVSLHHLFSRLDLPWTSRLCRPLLALLAATLVAWPWYGLLVWRLGFASLDDLFLVNSIGRARAQGSGDPELSHWIYYRFLWDSAKSARLFAPALVLSILSAAVGWKRFTWSLLAFLPGAFTLLISFAATKSAHYVYSAIPCFCVLTAAWLLIGLPASAPTSSGWTRNRTRLALAISGIAASLFLIQSDCRRISWWMQIPRWEYPPFEVDQAITRHAASDCSSLILYRFPQAGEPMTRDQLRNWLGVAVQFYQPRLPHALQVTEVEEINRLLATGKPAVLFLPPHSSIQEFQKAGLAFTPDRASRLRTRHNELPVMTFHGAESKLSLEACFHQAEMADSQTLP